MLMETERNSPNLNSIPVVTYDELKKGDVSSIHKIGESFQKFGIIRIAHHPLKSEARAKLLDVAKQFFSLSAEVKQQYFDSKTNGMIGHIKLPDGLKDGGQSGVGYFLEGAEFWHSYKEPFDRQQEKALMIENVWPKEVENFRSHVMESSELLNEISYQVLRALAIFAKVPADIFRPLIHNGWSMHRLMQYPANPKAVPGTIRVLPHRDVTVLSFLMAGNNNGLEVLHHKKWLPVTTEQQDLLVSASEILEILTGGFYKSCYHRVVHTPTSHLPRTTFIYFAMPAPQVMLHPLPHFSLRENSKMKTKEINFMDYLEQNLLVNLSYFKERIPQ